jgi:uncharacterized protein
MGAMAMICGIIHQVCGWRMRSVLSVLLFIAFILPISAQQKTKNTIVDDLCAARLADVVVSRRKATAGDPDAQYQMGLAALGLGKPTPEALATASVWFRKAAEQGYAKAQDQIGRLNYGDDGDWKQAAFWFNKAAEQGNDDAQLWLGTMYESGRGVGQDKTEALKWHRLSAKQGNPDAQVSLGQMYEDGEIVPQNYLEAATWYRKAAEHFPNFGGAGEGQNSLADLYRQGRLPANYVDAYMWFAIVGSIDDMKRAAKHMTRSQIAEAQGRARQWMKTHPRNDDYCPQQKNLTTK